MPASHSPTATLIAGPTASGKSALAIKLARERNGAVINADSMQVYQELRILTARPTDEDHATVPHFLYGHVAGGEAYSAARYADECALTLEAVIEDGLHPIIVGGTGLYFRALLQGLSPVPAIPTDIRTHWRTQAEALGADALHDTLKVRDPVMADRLDPGDAQRITRALEVIDATGTSLADWQEKPGTPVLDEEDTERIVVAPDRADLHDRCNRRFELMIDNGALDEVAALADLQLDPGLPVMRALGVRPLSEHLRGDLTLEDAVEQAKAETRQYVKRQTTWLRSNMNTWNWISEQ